MTEAWVRWWRDGDDYPRDPRWSKWHHVMDDHPAGPLPCMPYGFEIPAGAERREDQPPRADACFRCIRRMEGQAPISVSLPAPGSGSG